MPLRCLLLATPLLGCAPAALPRASAPVELVAVRAPVAEAAPSVHLSHAAHLSPPFALGGGARRLPPATVALRPAEQTTLLASTP